MKSTRPRITELVQGLVLCVLFAFGGAHAPTASAAAAGEPRTATFDAYRSRALVFEPNRGQTDRRADFVARGAGYTAFVSASELAVALHARSGRGVVRMALVDANPLASAKELQPLPGVVNYAYGAGPKQQVTVPTYAEVGYDDVYPGIALVYHGREQQLEYDFVVAPGADPRLIRLAFAGVDALQIDGDGALVLDTPLGPLRKPRPVIYQERDGVRETVAGNYVVDAGGSVGFAVGPYDATHTLVIDPVLVYSSYLGGHGDDVPDGVAVDAAGNLYVAGTTTSLDFPATTANASNDVFVSKFDAAGALVYSTFLGTPCDDAAAGIAVDATGSAYVTGRAWEGWCSAEPPVPDYPGAFVAKLDPWGAHSYFFHFGPATFDSTHGRAIAVDAFGQAHVTGVTEPSSPGFPTTSAAYRTAPCSAGGSDGFVAKVDAAGTALVYSTYLCGSGHDSPNAIAIDAAGNAYVAGSTDSLDFPVVSAYQGSNRAAPYRSNAFVTKLDATGSALLYSTYLGGSDDTVAHGIALDAWAQAHVTGYTTAIDFPTTAGVVQPTPGSRSCVGGLCTDAFVTKLSADGGLAWSTYLSGDFDDWGVGIAVDGTGNAYVVGTTYSSTFPIVEAFHHRRPGSLGPDAFVTKLDAWGSTFVYSSYLGGETINGMSLEGHEDGLAIAVDSSGNAHVGGTTSSFNFATTTGAFQPALAAGTCGYLDYLCSDVFVTKVSADGPGVASALRVSVSPTNATAGGTVTASWSGVPGVGGGEDQLRLYRLGSTYHEYVAWWPTSGAASDMTNVQIPATRQQAGMS